MLSSRRFALAGVALLVAVLSVAPASAQSRHRVTRDPAELLAAYVRERQTPNAKPSASLDLTHVLTYHSDYPTADVQSLLQGLEQLALTATPPRLRAEAAFRLSIPGSHRTSRPLPGMFARLERVYRASSDPLVRSVVVDAMGDLADRREAVAFLEQVAAQHPPAFAGAAGRAMASLLTMGDEGRAGLKRLHETGAVRDPEAKGDLATLAKHGYRVP
jgi:HEAT repeat protein